MGSQEHCVPVDLILIRLFRLTEQRALVTLWLVYGRHAFHYLMENNGLSNLVSPPQGYGSSRPQIFSFEDTVNQYFGFFNTVKDNE